MRKLLISIAALLLSGSALAGPVSSTAAKEKAAAFLRQQAAHQTDGRRAAAMRNPQLTEAGGLDEVLHVFNNGNGNGYVIVSGDDSTVEILGYVDSGTFDINHIPDNMRAWLQGYADQIRSLGDRQVRREPRNDERAAVAPTCVTHWDQTDPFDSYILDDYPEQAQYYGNNLMTGCVATAMAQTMYTAALNYKAKHGDWPAIPTHTVPGYKITQTGITSTGWELPELPEYTFDWANMRTDNYSPTTYTDITDEQKKAVGKLMQYCGRSMKMEYDKTNSASVTVYVAPRLYDCLNMSKFVQSVDRSYYNSQEWEDIMYKEVSEGRSVVYAANVGTAVSSEGHCFVLDGYKDGLWHINWGWGKELAELNGQPKADGYFSLSVMQPMAGGSGAASAAEAQYKYLQQAIIGISYDDPDDVASALNFYWNGKNVYTSYIGGWGAYNVLGATITYEEGWAIRHADGTITDNIWNKTTEYEYPSIGVHSGTTAYFSEMTLPAEDGEYDIVHISREKGTTEWHASYGTDKNYVTITIAGGKVTKAVAHPVDVSKDCLEVTGIDFIGDMEANKDNIVEVTINNTGDDFFGTLGLYYSTGTSPESTKNVSMLATVKPGETTHQFTVKLPKGEYNIWLIANPTSYPSASSAFYKGKMFIGFGEDANKVQAGNLQFDGQEGATTLNVKSVNGSLAPVSGTFEVVNNSSRAYKQTYYVAVERVTSSYGSTTTTTFATTEVPVEVAGSSTLSVPFDLGTVTGLSSGVTYQVRLYSKSDDTEVTIATKDMTLQSYFRYWTADGTVQEYKEPTSWYQMKDVQAVAAAIDLRGVKKDYMEKVDNPNCLYYMTADQKPTSTYGEFGQTNNIIDGQAENIQLDAAYPFFVPEAFTVQEASITRTFVNGNNSDGKGWETLCLPFAVNSVKRTDTNRYIQWFHSAADKRKHFWLMEYTNMADGVIQFDYVSTFQPNVPYIIAVPGNKWGDDWNLAGVPIRFAGVDVEVPVTEMPTVAHGTYQFHGTVAPLSVEGFILNAEGTKFERQEDGSVAAYNAYFTSDDNASALRIMIAGDEVATGIDAVSTSDESAPQSLAPIFNLGGQRLSHPQKGVNIQEGKKKVILK